MHAVKRTILAARLALGLAAMPAEHLGIGVDEGV